jgi:hypothetical protein
MLTICLKGVKIFASHNVIFKNYLLQIEIEKLQKVLDALGEWAVEYGMKINPSKSKAIRFYESSD